MKMTYIILISTLCFGMIVLTLGTGTAYGKKTAMPPSCNAAVQIFPGDGYYNPDGLDVSGHGPALNYQDNGDGTFTDCNTKLMWEENDESHGIHDVSNTYTWSADSNPDGTLFTVFLNGLNNTCDGAGVDDCTTDADCVGIGNEVCGFAGYRDWRIPNVKELQSIVDYSKYNPAWSAPEEVGTAYPYWSATTSAGGTSFAWNVGFGNGSVNSFNKSGIGGFARAVRP